MKFQITMKDPDTLHDACDRAAKDDVAKLGLAADEAEMLVKKRAEKLRDFAGRWMEFGEYITVEFDTEAGTAVVVPR